MITRLHVLQESDRLKLLNQVPETEIAVFQDLVFITMAAIAQLVELSELEILKVFKNYEWVTVDLEFDERSHRFTIHDGESYTGRPLVTGITWLGLQCLAMEFDNERTRLLAHDLITIDFEMTSPQRLAAYYTRTRNLPSAPALSFGLKKKA